MNSNETHVMRRIKLLSRPKPPPDLWTPANSRVLVGAGIQNFALCAHCMNSIPMVAMGRVKLAHGITTLRCKKLCNAMGARTILCLDRKQLPQRGAMIPGGHVSVQQLCMLFGYLVCGFSYHNIRGLHATAKGIY
jgi:hypothetical protein